MDLDPALAHLVTQTMGSTPRRAEALQSGLGAHHFVRVVCEDGRRVVARIDTGRRAGSGPEPPLEPVRALLEDAQLPVPRRLGSGDGIELLEDLGNESLRDRAAGEPTEALRALYRQAVGLVPRLQEIDRPEPAIPAFERHLADFLPLKRERTLERSLPAWLGRAPGPDERACVDESFEAIERAVREAPARLAHRDLQSSNLMVCGDQLVMIDLQGAFLAPPEYDLVCLLRDSYVVLPDDWVRALAEEARRALPAAPDPATFAHRFDLLTIARKAKDDAFFVDAATRGDTRYLRYREANRRYLLAAATRLADTLPCFERWGSWLEASAVETASCAP